MAGAEPAGQQHLGYQSDEVQALTRYADDDAEEAEVGRGRGAARRARGAAGGPFSTRRAPPAAGGST